MEREGDSRPARVVRLRNTVRLELQKDAGKDVKERFCWEWLVQKILQGLLQIQRSKIFCLQDFSAAGFLDLTFTAYADCLEFFERCSQRLDHEELQGIRLTPLFTLGEVPVTVHLYNPFVEDDVIRAFLGRYCTAVSLGEKIQGRFGIWNGKRRFRVRFRDDPVTSGAFLHPPGSFAIGPHKGFLHYPGQPLYCRRCGGLGHSKEVCPGQRCRFCGAEDHVAANCGAPKTCGLCGDSGHLFRQCPVRIKLDARETRAEEAHPGPSQEGKANRPADLPARESATSPAKMDPAHSSTAATSDQPPEKTPWPPLGARQDKQEDRAEGLPPETPAPPGYSPVAGGITAEGRAELRMPIPSPDLEPLASSSVSWAEVLDGFDLHSMGWEGMEVADRLPDKPIKTLPNQSFTGRGIKRAWVKPAQEFDILSMEVEETMLQHGPEGTGQRPNTAAPNGEALPPPHQRECPKGQTGDQKESGDLTSQQAELEEVEVGWTQDVPRRAGRGRSRIRDMDEEIG